MDNAERALKTIKIKSAANAHFMTAEIRSNARVFCRPGRPLLFHQVTNDTGTVQFQVVDRSLVDYQLFLSYTGWTGAPRLKISNHRGTFRVTNHNGYKTLERSAEPGTYVFMNKDNSPYIRKRGDGIDKSAQWLFEDSDFVVQPILAFGHMCNDLKYVKETLDRGGNAIECDIQVENSEERSKPYDFLVTHSEFAPSHGGGKTGLKEYLSGLRQFMPRLAAVIFDCKEADGVDYTKYGTDLVEAIVEAGICPTRCIISVPKPECRAMLSAKAVVDNDFQRDVSMIELQPVCKEHGKWLKTAEEMGCNWLGMGITNFAPSPMSAWLGPLKHSVANKRKQGTIYKVYFWTLDSRSTMRKVLQAGADGVICNINAIFHDALPSMKVLIDRDLTRRMATPLDSLAESYDFEMQQ